MDNYKRLGDYIRLVDVRNGDNAVSNLKGISTTKNLIQSIANTTGVNLATYKVVKRGQFAYVSDTSRRGDKIALALCEEDACIISSIYSVFEVKDINLLHPEYLMIWFRRAEFDRYARFHSWGSARETFGWEDMCNIELPIPSIDRQRELAAIYRSLLNQIGAYEQSIPRLQKICEDYIVHAKKTEPIVALGEYITQLDERNSENITNVKGISTSKVMIDTVANMSGVSVARYKVVNTGEFAYVSDTSRRGDKIALAKNDNEPCVVSSIYTVFKTKSGLDPDFLMIWFRRTEFDRYARFHSWGSARETFDWDDMCNVQIPLPSQEKQRSIVAIYNAMQTQKEILQKLKDKLVPLCPVLAKGAETD